jgi:hypothetical protein
MSKEGQFHLICSTMCKYQSVVYDSNGPKENALLGVRNEGYLIATKKIVKKKTTQFYENFYESVLFASFP